MNSWQEGDVASNGIRLHYTRTGGAKPPVVLLHGFSDDGLCWTPVAESLEADYDVIMLDARGHGRSEAPATGYGPPEHAADAAGAIAALGLHKPALLGHSMGAATSLELASTYPEVPRAILLEDPPTWWVKPPEMLGPDDERVVQRRNSIHRLKEMSREELLAWIRTREPNWSEAEIQPWADSKLRLNLNVLSQGPAPGQNWQTSLRHITCPTFLIVGDVANGALVGEEDAAALHALVPQLRVAHIAQSSHSIRRDQLDQYMSIVRSFLAETATGQ